MTPSTISSALLSGSLLLERSITSAHRVDRYVICGASLSESVTYVL